jgi:LytS/YehU family sensor histidine kinase
MLKHEIHITTNLEIAFFVSILLFWTILAYMLHRIRKVKAAKVTMEEQYKQLEKKMNALELENIKYKLNPHLFKNALNSIQSHAYQTYYSLDKLANVLDFILYESDKKFVTLKEEMEFSLSLIEINRLKLSPLFDLRIKNKIGEGQSQYEMMPVAPLITVDLIENAFKHADFKAQDAFISIVYEVKDNQFLLTVSNKISPKPMLKKSNSGFGNDNFTKRLDIIYGDKYSLDRFVQDEIYTAHLKIDLFEQQGEMYIAG